MDDASLVVFEINDQRYALPLAAVERVVRAVEVTTLPRAPAAICGAINVQGRVIPVLNLRRRLGLPERGLEVSDEFLILQISGRWLALWVDAVCDVISSTAQAMIAAEQITPGLEDIEAVVKCVDGLVLVHNPERLLALAGLVPPVQNAGLGEAAS